MQAEFTAFAALGWPIHKNLQLLEDTLGLMPRDKFNLVARALKQTPDPALFHTYNDRCEGLVDEIFARGDFKLHKGVPETLAHISKTSMRAVASNNPPPRTRGAIKSKGLCKFFSEQMILGPLCNGTLAKPNPAMLRKAMRLCGVRPDQTVMVGDSESDMLAAKAAGVYAMGFVDKSHSGWVGRAEKLKRAGADIIFSDYSPAAWDAIVPMLPRVAQFNYSK